MLLRSAKTLNRRRYSSLRLLSANHYWRICAAGLSYVVFGLGAFLPGIYVFLLALWPMDSAQKQRKARTAIQKLCRFYVDFMQFLGLMQYRLSGLPQQPVTGHLVIANHSMLIDALFMLAYVPNLCCVVKSALLSNPFTRIPVRLAGYLANDDEALVEQAVEKLHRGENLLIFPEGTRNNSDLQLEFKRGAANIAVHAGCPILPAVICCQPRALLKGQAWYELPDTKSLISVKFYPPIALTDCIDTSLPRPKQYRRLTAWLRNFYFDELSAILEQPSSAL